MPLYPPNTGKNPPRKWPPPVAFTLSGGFLWRAETRATAQRRDDRERFEGRPGQGGRGHVSERQQRPSVLANHTDPASVVALGYPPPVHNP